MGSRNLGSLRGKVERIYSFRKRLLQIFEFSRHRLSSRAFDSLPLESSDSSPRSTIGESVGCNIVARRRSRG